MTLMTRHSLQGSMLGSGLTNTNINDIDSVVEHTFSKLSDDPKLSGAADIPEGWDAIHRDLERFKK